MADTSLEPVIVGGLIAMGGVLISGTITLAVSFIQTRAERKKRRADKFEEFVTAVYEFDHWLEGRRLKQAYGEDIEDGISPFAKMQSISSVYFPQFDGNLNAVSTAASRYQLWISEAAQRRIAMSTNINDGFADAYRPYVTARDALVDALKTFARAEFQEGQLRSQAAGR